MRGEARIIRNRVGREGREVKEEREKFECRFEEIKGRGSMIEIRKGVVKMFLIFEGELYVFVMMGMM